jgi:beta-N-acetylhexosaminidase
LIDSEFKNKIGQMIMVGFKEAELAKDSPVVRAIKDFSLGGVILYNIDLKCYLGEQKKNPSLTRYEAARLCPRNIISLDQLKNLTSILQSYSKNRLLIGVDEEGGLVSRLGPAAGFPETESPKALGEKNDLAITAKAAKTTARNLRQSGINFNLAPVVDLNLNPESPISRNGRSFGSDPNLVYRHAIAFTLAHRQQGIPTTLKHFPGKGSAKEDTHFQMAEVTSSYQPQELYPFSWLIEEGLADAVMTSHILHRDWDAEYPITLSPKILRGFLRDELGFQGVIISDDLLMGAIVNRFGLEEACWLAVEAGIDILLASNNSPEGYDSDLFMRMFEALIKGIEQGRISKSMIEASYPRIMALKNRRSKKNNNWQC